MAEREYTVEHGDDLARAVQDVHPERQPADGEDANDDAAPARATNEED